MATLTTPLEAVNSMLGHIGEAPVNSIADTSTLPVSASTALSVLDEVSREVQTMGWHFNTTNKFTLTPQPDNTIQLPANTLHVDATDGSKDVVQRGLKLYDRKNNTNEFSGSLDVTITFLLDWDDLHEQARRYITLRASRIFQTRMMGSRELEALIARDEFIAKSQLEEVDSRGSDRTIFDNYDVYTGIGINRNYDI
tara:strand:+ start:153 stop:743 length:591 start_codon:yes stop_codon:yes gene_type:complete